MAYRVEYARSVEKDLRKLPKEAVEQALEVIREKIATDPHVGVPLKGQYRGLWKYRVRSYRIIYSIEKDRLVVLVVRIRHRKEVYLGLITHR